MTIKWGDPIECNGVRPDWLRDDEPAEVENSPREWLEWSGCVWHKFIQAIRLPADHPAYVALAHGFHPWSGGESAPDDWDGGAVLQRCGYEANPAGVSWVWPWRTDASEDYDIIGYRKRNTRFDEPHLARIEVEGAAPVEGVFIKRMTEAEARDWIMNHTYTESAAHILHALGQLGLVESRAERFTRETGHAVTEAVEAALNWKDTQS